MSADPKAVDVLAVLKKHIKARAMWLPVGGVDLCGEIRPDVKNPVHAACIKHHDNAVAAHSAVDGLMGVVAALIQRHDAEAKKSNFALCGCSDCTELRPALARCGGAS